MKFVTLLSLCTALAIFGSCRAFFKHQRPSHNIFADPNSDNGKRVHFTDFLDNHEELRAATQVNGIGNHTSYAGFWTVRPETDNNLFTWYFPAQNGNASAPLLIWLQGGPGGSSLFGLFAENGPFTLTEDLEVLPKEYTWNTNYAQLFIDNPVGAGYSYTGNGQGWATNQTDCANDLYALMLQFYQAFPETKTTDLYITGESFAGHYIPAFAYKIHMENQAGVNFKIPLAGVAIGDGWTDPGLQMLAIPDMMYNLALADTPQKKVLENYVREAYAAVEIGDTVKAFDIWDLMLNGDVWPYPTLFYNITGSLDYDNFQRTEAPEEFGYYQKYVTQDTIRAAIHAGNATFNSGLECELHIKADIMASYKMELGVVMDNYKVLMYNGQLDLIVGPALTRAYIGTISWSGAAQFLTAERTVWKLEEEGSTDDVAGFVRVVETPTSKFWYALVRGAGHIVPYDQGARAKDLISRFVEDLPFPQK